MAAPMPLAPAVTSTLSSRAGLKRVHDSHAASFLAEVSSFVMA